MSHHEGHDSSKPLQELKHDAVPGYPKLFTLVFTAASAYLALIFLLSTR